MSEIIARMYNKRIDNHWGALKWPGKGKRAERAKGAGPLRKKTTQKTRGENWKGKKGGYKRRRKSLNITVSRETYEKKGTQPAVL